MRPSRTQGLAAVFVFVQTFESFWILTHLLITCLAVQAAIFCSSTIPTLCGARREMAALPAVSAGHGHVQFPKRAITGSTAAPMQSPNTWKDLGGVCKRYSPALVLTAPGKSLHHIAASFIPAGKCAVLASAVAVHCRGSVARTLFCLVLIDTAGSSSAIPVHTSSL